MRAARTSIQLEIWVPAIDVFRPNHSMAFLPARPPPWAASHASNTPTISPISQRCSVTFATRRSGASLLPVHDKRGSLGYRMIWKTFPQGSQPVGVSTRAASACRPRRGRFCASVTLNDIGSIRGNNARADALSIIAINAI
jgi:hypothetical protein